MWFGWPSLCYCSKITSTEVASFATVYQHRKLKTCGGLHWLAHPPSQDILSSIHRNHINIETELQVKWQQQSRISV